MSIWHDMDPKRISPEDFIAVIEIPKGSKKKYELDKQTGLIILDRVLHTSTHYPANYGFIPRTYGDDGDPLDIRPIYQDLKSMSFGVESEVRARICTYQKSEIEILADVYSPEVNLKCELEKIELNQNVINKSECTQIKQEVPVQDFENVRILNICATPVVTKNNVLDEKVMIEGSLELDVLFFNRNTNTIEAKKVDVPVVQTIRVENLKANMKPEIKIDVGNITYAKTTLNSIEVQVPLCVKVEVSKKEYINGIKGVEVSNEELPEIPSLIIYYVKSGDSLWKIAKKYRTTVEDIMKYNDLKDDKIYPGDQLMIAKKIKCKAVELL